MNYKKLIVSEENKLVFEDYNLTSDDAQIIDLDKSLEDVCNDPELQQFIITTAVEPTKIYFVCLKEDFGSYEQRIENIKNVKSLYKILKKKFKQDNIYFFIYNTFMKNDVAVSPTLTKKEENASAIPSTENYGSSDFADAQAPLVDDNFIANDSFDEQAMQNVVAEDDFTKDLDDFANSLDQKNTPHVEQNVENASVEYVEAPGVAYDAPIANYDDQIQGQEINQQDEYVPIVEDSEFVQNESTSQPIINEQQFVSDTSNLAYDANDYQTNQEMIYQPEDFDSLSIPNDPAESIIEDTTRELDEMANPEWDSLDVSNLETASPTPTAVEDDVRHADIDINHKGDSIDDFLASDYDKKEESLIRKEDQMFAEIPESFYDANDLSGDEIDFDEFVDAEILDEFKNDYELNVHALKSIYDFIWRMLILNNYNLKLNDLLYLSVNNLNAFSIGQSDFVRQIANKGDSLFDLILQLDIKLEFNNTLFYIYLAELFTIKANSIEINPTFLNALAIWVNKASKDKFVNQVEQFINYSAIYNKKIVFAHFIELANFVKGCMISIKPTMTLVDVHRIVSNRFKRVRNENIFGFLIEKTNEIFKQVGIKIESEIFETPDNMFDDNKKVINEMSWKEKLIDLYKRLLSNIRNFVLTKGNNEIEIFNIYVDIKDLKMHIEENSENLLVLQDDFNSNPNSGYLTIGDAFDRSPSVVPKESYKEQINREVEEFYQSLESTSTPTQDSLFLNNNQTTQQTSKGNNMNDMNKANSGLAPEAPSYEGNQIPNSQFVDQAVNNPYISEDEKFKYVSYGLEDMMSKKISEYEKKIKENISRIEAERKQLRAKMEELKNL